MPGIYVDRIVQATEPKQIELLTIATEKTPEIANAQVRVAPGADIRHRIAARAAREIRDGYYINLGVGIPTLVTEHLPPGVNVWLESENGILGMGPFPSKDKVDACVSPRYLICTELPLMCAGMYTAILLTPERRRSACSLGRRSSTRGGSAVLLLAACLLTCVAQRVVRYDPWRSFGRGDPWRHGVQPEGRPRQLYDSRQARQGYVAPFIPSSLDIDHFTTHRHRRRDGSVRHPSYVQLICAIC